MSDRRHITHSTVGPYAELGATIRRARLATGFSQEQLAKKLGIGRRSVIRYENGTRVPRGRHAATLARLLDLDPELLTR